MLIIIIALILIGSSSVLSVNPNDSKVINTRSTSGVCDNPQELGFTLRLGTQKYYRIIDVLLPWIDGETLCERYGAHLPIVYNDNDIEFLKALVGNLILQSGETSINKANADPGIWLAGYLSIITKNWQWINGKPFNMTAWTPGQPDNSGGTENCLGLWYSKALGRYNSLNDYQCSWYMLVVCELDC